MHQEGQHLTGHVEMTIGTGAALEGCREDEQTVAVGILSTEHIVDVLRNQLEHAACLTSGHGHGAQESAQKRSHAGEPFLIMRYISDLGNRTNRRGSPVEEYALRPGVAP